MAVENKGERHVLTGRNALVVALVSALVGGAGGPLLLVKFGGPNIFRQDPYTQSMAEADRKVLESRVATLERHVNYHPDTELRAAINELTAEAAAAKSERALIIKNQDRIIQQLDRRQ